MESGIYQWKSIKDNKVYIGQAQNFNERKREHLSDLRGNHHHNLPLQNAWNECGEANFVHEILLRMNGNLNKTETIMINAIPPELRYNIALDGLAPMKGKKHTIESKQRMSKAHKGKKHSLERNTRQSERMKGKTHSEETRERLKEAWKNRPPMTNETRTRISTALKGKLVGEQNPMYGKPSPNKGKLQLITTGENNPSAKLTEIQAKEIKILIKEGKLLQREIGALYGVSHITISDIKRGKTWQNIILN